MTQLLLTSPSEVTADFSACGRFRFRLDYRWSPGPLWAFCLLNPSVGGGGQTSDNLDPTLRRCMGFARAGGAGAMAIVNLSPFVGTDPADLWAALDRGEDVWQKALNRRAIVDSAVEAHDSGGKLVCGWGGFSKANGAQWRAAAFRADKLLDSVRMRGVSPQALALTKSGSPRQPRHPLYLPKGLVPRPLAEMRRGGA